MAILEVLEEQFGQLIQSLFRQAVDIVELLFKFISTEKLEQDGTVIGLQNCSVLNYFSFAYTNIALDSILKDDM